MKARKSLWMIPVLLLITALGSTAAHADTLLPSSTATGVTEIDGIKIGSTVYDVTFSMTDNGTFATDPTDASTAATDLLNDLNSDTQATGVCKAGGTGCILGLFLMTVRGRITLSPTTRTVHTDAHRRLSLNVYGSTREVVMTRRSPSLPTCTRTLQPCRSQIQPPSCSSG